MTESVWVVAADSSRARVFSSRGGLNATLTEAFDLAEPEARLHETEITTDKAGALFARGGPARSAAEPSQLKREQAPQRLAKEVCERLTRLRDTGTLDRLYLVAEPRFLGLLRQSMDQATARRVVTAEAKNITTHSVSAIRRCLPANL